MAIGTLLHVIKSNLDDSHDSLPVLDTTAMIYDSNNTLHRSKHTSSVSSTTDNNDNGPVMMGDEAYNITSTPTTSTPLHTNNIKMEEDIYEEDNTKQHHVVVIPHSKSPPYNNTNSLSDNIVVLSPSPFQSLRPPPMLNTTYTNSHSSPKLYNINSNYVSLTNSFRGENGVPTDGVVVLSNPQMASFINNNNNNVPDTNTRVNVVSASSPLDMDQMVNSGNDEPLLHEDTLLWKEFELSLLGESTSVCLI